ncbi:MAG: hypothetical protein KF756_07855 [Acidobacteria bacterium]|nr:hypothetical protein [Acidobacteriota bacterium]
MKEYTDFNDILKRMEEERLQTVAKAVAHAKDILDKLTLAGSEAISIYFDGSGDEGSVHAIDGLNENEHIDEEELEDWAYDLIAGTGVDWYNNEGGFGTINIDVPKRTYNFEVHYRRTTLGASGTAIV